MQVKKKARLYINGCSYIGGLYESNSPVSTPDDCSNYPLSNIFENAVCNPRLDTHSVDAGHGGDNNDSIFRRTMIDCSKHKFDFVIVCWSHATRWEANDFTSDWQTDEDNLKLLEKDSKSKWYPTPIPHGYIDAAYASETLNYHQLQLLYSEPYATDRTIFHTISLHNFFKQKNIPHLFINMGSLYPSVIKARKEWLSEIDTKNYLSSKEEDIVGKMSFSFTSHYRELHKPNPVITNEEKFRLCESAPEGDFRMSDYYNNNYIVDEGNHLGDPAYVDIRNRIYNHIKTHDLLNKNK